MEVYVKDIVKVMDEWAPPTLAESWDNPGLQVGDPEQPVHTVLVSLDLTRANLDYAMDHGVDMIVSHHPFLFKAIKNISLTTEKGRMISDLLTGHISAFAAHTNLDTAQGGVNDALASALQLRNCTGLVPIQPRKRYKIVVYVPEGHADRVRQAMAGASAGREGAYSDCAFSSRGTGHFAAGENSHPFLGRPREETIADEVRIESFVEEKDLDAVKAAIVAAHPYESPVYDLYELAENSSWETMGRVGDLPHPMSGEEAVLYVKKQLGMASVRFTGRLDQVIERVAVLGGAGAEFMKLAKAAGADLYLTGDVKYHEAQEARALDLFLIDGGHFDTEKVIIPWMARYLRRAAEDRQWAVTVVEDPVSSDIFSYR